MTGTRPITAALALLVTSWLLVVLMVSGHPTIPGVRVAARHVGAPMIYAPPAPGAPLSVRGA